MPSKSRDPDDVAASTLQGLDMSREDFGLRIGVHTFRVFRQSGDIGMLDRQLQRHIGLPEYIDQTLVIGHRGGWADPTDQSDMHMTNPLFTSGSHQSCRKRSR